MIQRQVRVNSIAPGADSAALRRPAPRKPYQLLVGMLLSLVTVVVILGISAILWQQHYRERVMPGVWVAGIPLQGLTSTEAEGALREAWTAVGPRHLTLHGGDRQWLVPLEELGISWDLPATVHAAMAIGRSGSFGPDWLVRLRGMQRGMDVPAEWTFDEGLASLTLRRLSKEIDQPARAATFEVVGIAPHTQPGQEGRELDIDATLQRLREAVADGLPPAIDLVIPTTVPAVVDGEQARQHAEALLARLLALTFTEDGTDYAWALGREVIARALEPRQEVGTDGLTRWALDIKPAPLAEWVAAIAQEIDRPLIEGRVRIDPATMQASVSVPSQSGRQVDTAEALQRLQAALEGDGGTVELPVQVVRPYITPETIASWGRLSLLSEGVTYFKGSDAGRAHNIILGASRYPGVVVPPGAVFSFNQYLGQITAAEGWAEAYVIMGDRTELGAGGGICQVATTAYRAAFFGGFPIVERYPHSYRVGWYEPPAGLDAAVFTPTADMRFQNDLQIPVIIDTSVDRAAAKLTFRFYGPGELGRTVELEGPVLDRPVKAPPPIYEDDPSLAPGQVVIAELAKDGVRATVYRIIKQDGQVIARQQFVSNYEPWPARYRRGPAG